MTPTPAVAPPRATPVNALRAFAFRLLGPAREDDRLSRGVDVFLATLISVNVAAFVLETVAPLYASYEAWFRALERASLAVFTIEYVLRVWSSVEDSRYSDPVRGRLKFARTPLALIDLAVIAPFLIPGLGTDLRSARVLRLLRIFWFAKLGRYSSALQTFGRVARAKKAELSVVGILLVVLLVISSTLLYFAESPHQDEFGSIPAAMWWAITTLTTVGYGDILPVTALGRVLAAFVAVLGVGMFALPTGILGAAFVEEIQTRKELKTEAQAGALQVCPHCGKVIDTSESGS
jgi:voltage-gated potassium channel